MIFVDFIFLMIYNNFLKKIRKGHNKNNESIISR